MQAPAAIVSGNHAAGFDHVPLGRAGLKHQQNAALGDLEGDEARRIDKRLESEQIAIERRRAFEVARIERRFQDALNRRRAALLRHPCLRTRSFDRGGHCGGLPGKSPNAGFES